MKAVSKLIILSVVAVMVTLLGLQLSAAPALAERRSIGGEPVFPGGPTYERTIQTYFETYVFPAELKYQGVGVERDNVIVEKVERDGNSFWFSVRARYSGNIFGVGVAERVRVHYDNGHIRVDLGGLIGFVNTRSIADTLIPQLANGTGSGSGGQSGSGHYFYFRNNCHKPVRLILRYKQLSGQWITQGWYSFDGNEASYLNFEPGVKLRSNNSIFYYYAEATDGSGSIWSGDEYREFGGQSLPMKKTEVSLDSDSDWNLGIRCSS